MSVLATALKAVDAMYDEPRLSHRDLLIQLDERGATIKDLRRRIRLARRELNAVGNPMPTTRALLALDLRRPLRPKAGK